MLNREGIAVKMTRRYCLVCLLLSKPKKQPVGQPGGKLEPVLTVSGDGKWCSCCEKCGGSSKIKNRIDTGSSSSISVSTQKNSKHILKSSFIPVLTAPSFLQPQRGKRSKEPSTNEGGSQMQAHTYNGILFCLKKDKF